MKSISILFTYNEQQQPEWNTTEEKKMQKPSQLYRRTKNEYKKSLQSHSLTHTRSESHQMANNFCCFFTILPFFTFHDPLFSSSVCLLLFWLFVALARSHSLTDTRQHTHSGQSFGISYRASASPCIRHATHLKFCCLVSRVVSVPSSYSVPLFCVRSYCYLFRL